MQITHIDAKQADRAAPAADVVANSPCVVRDYTPGDEAAVLDLLGRTLPRWGRAADPAALWRWKHFANPFGPSNIVVAYIGDQLAGVGAAMQWRLQRASLVYECTRGVDLATDPAFARTGVATQMGHLGYQTSVETGVSMVLFTPNQNSARLAEREGRKLVGVLRPEVRVMRLIGAIRAWRQARRRILTPSFGSEPTRAWRRNPLPVGEWIRQERPAIEDLIEHDRDRDPAQFRTLHTCEYLHWRYAANPQPRSYVVLARDREVLKGALVFRIDDYFSARRVLIEDVFLRSDDPITLQELRRALKRTVAADLVQAALPARLSRALLGGRAHFLGRGYGLVLRRMDPALGDVPFQQENWQLTLGDLREF